MKTVSIVFIFVIALFSACDTKTSSPSATTALELPDSLIGTFWDHNLSVDERAEDLVSKMTIEEKIAQTLYNAPAIERLNVPPYNWWNECLHGVARAGRATVFPQPIGMAATFDTALMKKVASAISDEARIKYRAAIENDNRSQYTGLTFWTPNINIFRDPRWGRGMETWGRRPLPDRKNGCPVRKRLAGR